MFRNMNVKPIFCLQCGKFVRWADKDEILPLSGGADATKWFCTRNCLLVYARTHGQNVVKPSHRSDDIMQELINEYLESMK